MTPPRCGCSNGSSSSAPPTKFLPTEAATVSERGRDTGLPLAGSGAPCVSEFAIVELAAALGLTVESCKRHVGQVLEVRYRLRRIWETRLKGDLQWWRAARIAQHTLHLPKAGAVHVDRRLAAVAHKVGPVYTEKLCAEALDTYDPTEAEQRRQAAADGRKVDVHLDQAGRHGSVDIAASTDTGDALDFETAIAAAAAQLAQDGCTESLDIRRSMALGLIARHYLTGGNPLGRNHQQRQHRPTVPKTPPHQNPRTMALPIHPTRGLPVAITRRPLVPPRQPRHHRPRPTWAIRST